MKPQESTGLAFPPWELPNGLGPVGPGVGSVGQAGRAERLAWLCKRESAFPGRTARLSSTGREATERLGNAGPGELRSCSLALLPAENQPGSLCRGGEGVAFSFSNLL